MRLNLAVSALAAACSASSGAGPFAVVVDASDVPTPMTKTKKAAGNDGQPVGLRYANNGEFTLFALACTYLNGQS